MSALCGINGAWAFKTHNQVQVQIEKTSKAFLITSSTLSLHLYILPPHCKYMRRDCSRNIHTVHLKYLLVSWGVCQLSALCSINGALKTYNQVQVQIGKTSKAFLHDCLVHFVPSLVHSTSLKLLYKLHHLPCLEAYSFSQTLISCDIFHQFHDYFDPHIHRLF